MGEWSNLTQREKSNIIRFAIKNGVSDINTIRDTFNVYAKDSLANVDYNMAAAKASGFGSNGNGHYPDIFKKPNHPTFSDESIYHSEATPGGRWRGNTYEPSDYILNRQGGWNNFLKGFYGQEQGTGAVPVFNGGVMLPEVTVTPQYKDGGKIYIKPSKRGTFTAAATKHGKSVQEFARQVLANKENYSPAMVRKAVFAHNSKSWKHSTGGPLYPFSFQKNPYWKTPVVRYQDGGDIKVPSREEIVTAAWANENPNNRGKLSNGLWGQYPDPNGKGFNVGPGLLVGARIGNKETYTKKELDDTVYKFGLEGLKAIGDSYNEKYGTPDFPTPFDTVSVAPKMLMLDTRYQNGSLPQVDWPALYEAVVKGNWAEAIRQTRSTYKDENDVVHYDNDRVRRRAETIFPGMFDVFFIPDSKTMPVVTKKKKK